MKMYEIRRMPTTSDGLTQDVDKPLKIHESVFRSFHIVDKVVELCTKEVPYDLIIEIIHDLQTMPNYHPSLDGISNDS